MPKKYCLILEIPRTVLPFLKIEASPCFSNCPLFWSTHPIGRNKGPGTLFHRLFRMPASYRTDPRCGGSASAVAGHKGRIPEVAPAADRNDPGLQHRREPPFRN